MYELPGVDVFDGLENLIDYVFFMDFFKNSRSNDGVQVRFHEIKYHVQVFVVFSFDYILELDDVFVAIQLIQELHLSKSSLSICGIMKGIEHLFQSDYLLSFLVLGFPHNAVRALAHSLDDLIFPENVWLNFLTHNSISSSAFFKLNLAFLFLFFFLFFFLSFFLSLFFYSRLMRK